MSFLTIVLLFFVGCVGGWFSGLLGIGGGVIYVVVFNYILNKISAIQDSHIQVQLILLNSIFAIFFAALSGCIKQYKSNNFFLKEVLLAGIPAVVFSLGFTYFIHQWKGYNKESFLLVFTFALVPLILKFFSKKKDITTKAISPKLYSIGGSISGTVTAFTGLGGGVVLNPFLHGIFNLELKKTLSIALGNMLLSTFFITLYHIISNDFKTIEVSGMFHGIYFPMVLPVALGNMLFSPLGVATAQRLEDRQIKWIFIVFTSIIIFHNLYGIFVKS